MSAKTVLTLTQLRQAVERLILSMDGQTPVPTDSVGGTRPITFIPRADDTIPGSKSHIYQSYVLANAENLDSDYPKVSISVDGGIHNLGIGGQVNEQVGFDIIIVMKDVTAPSDPESQVGSMIEKVVDDLRWLVERNARLFDTPGVLGVSIADWTTDSGASFPEGTAFFKLVIGIRR